MQKRIIPIALLFTTCFFINLSYAQLNDQRNQNAAISDSLVALYRNGFGKSERLYTGTEYMGYVRRPKGHPFFISDQFLPATISFDGADYKDSILYDLVNDVVVVSDPTEQYNINVVNDKVKAFEVASHKFVRLDGIYLRLNQFEPGYYEELYNGKLQVFVRHKKQINSHTVQSEVVSEYVQYDVYLIRKGEEFIRVFNNNSLLDALDDHRGEVRRFMHEQNLDFRKDPVNTLRLVAAFFDGKSTIDESQNRRTNK